MLSLGRGCQTQTTLRAVKATKTTEWAAKFQRGPILQKFVVKNDFIKLCNILSI
jgi:hypothetical protein